MNKKLIIAIILLTLPMLIPDMSEYSSISAQDWINEDGYQCEEDDGYRYVSPIPCDAVTATGVPCDNCHKLIDSKDVEEHYKSCYSYCPWCDKYMTDEEYANHNSNNCPARIDNGQSTPEAIADLANKVASAYGVSNDIKLTLIKSADVTDISSGLSKYVNTFSKLGKVISIGGVAYSVYQGGVNLYNGNIDGALMNSLDIVAIGVGIYGGPVGLGVSGLWTIYRLTSDP